MNKYCLNKDSTYETVQGHQKLEGQGPARVTESHSLAPSFIQQPALEHLLCAARRSEC